MAAGGSSPQVGAQFLPDQARAQLRFTGTGAEYFRVWIVHSLLTILTLGIYSAWAKVRKARWFAQHTRLLGDSFDYHGRPGRILLGRCAALALFLAYSWSFEWNATAGLVVIGFLFLLGPVLFASAQRFRLVNTSWRGLRFGFDAPRTRIYAVCIPLLLVWTAGTVWTALKGSVVGAAALTIASVLLWPAVHASLKALQHRHARFGNLRFDFRPSIGAFYGLYARAFGFSLLMIVLLGFLTLIATLTLRAFDVVPARDAARLTGVGGIAAAVFLYMACWPYFAARMQQLVWSRTFSDSLHFRSSISAEKLWSLTFERMLLVIVTLGLYWPFAAVAIAKYRVESLSVETDGQWPTVSAPKGAAVGAVGDAALDMFGLDLGL